VVGEMALEAAFGVGQSGMLNDRGAVRATDQRALSRQIRAPDVQKEKALQEEQIQEIEDAIARRTGGLRYLREGYT
jgi:hypothetical protein